MHIDQATLTIILAALLSVSEALALIPSIKANGLIDTVIKVLQAVSKKNAPTDQKKAE